MVDLLDRIDKGDEPPVCEYSNINEGEYLKDGRVLKWSPKSEYLIIFGFEKLAIIDFTDNNHTKYEII